MAGKTHDSNGKHLGRLPRYMSTMKRPPIIKYPTKQTQDSSAMDEELPKIDGHLQKMMVSGQIQVRKLRTDDLVTVDRKKFKTGMSVRLLSSLQKEDILIMIDI